MAVSTIAHKPGLTADEARAIFERHFGDRYKIEDFKSPLVKRDFVVVKNAFVGVALKLEQEAGSTKFVYAGLCPKLWARMLMGGLIGLLVWNGLTGEIKQFIESAPEFR